MVTLALATWGQAGWLACLKRVSLRRFAVDHHAEQKLLH